MQMQERRSKILTAAIAVFYVVACLWVTPHGFDAGDTGALLAQYAQPLNPAESISIGTFLTVWTGHWINAILPFGQLYVFSLLAWVLFGAEAFLVYRVLRPYLPSTVLAALTVGGVFMNKFFDLLGYNNWTIFWFIVMLALLDQWMRSDRLGWLFAAGCMVGISMGFRLPNILQGLMVLGVFWYVWHSRSFRKAWGEALLYCAGIVVSIAAVWGSYAAYYGLDALASKLPGYANRLGQSTSIGYSAEEMLTALFTGLVSGALMALAAMLAICIAAWLICRLTKNGAALRTLAVAGCSVLLTAGLACSVMNFTSAEWLNVRRPSLCLIAAFSLLVCLGCAFLFAKRDPHFSTLCVFAVGMILIVTLGTNNGTLFFMMGMMYSVPMAAAGVMRVGALLRQSRVPRWSGEAVTLTKIVGMALFCTLAVFNFFTYEYLDLRAWNTTESIAIPEFAGMKTTEQRSAMYEEFVELTQDQQGEPLLLYGSFPIGFYLSEMEPATGQIWMDLDSYSLEQMDEALDGLEEEQEWPVVIFAYTFGPDYRYGLDKWERLEQFVTDNEYGISYESPFFRMYEKNEGK